MNKCNITIICGGVSVEHDISLCSARYLIESCDLSRYSLSVIVVTKDGHWHMVDDLPAFIEHGWQAECPTIPVMPAIGIEDATWISTDGSQQWHTDVVFPIIHGSLGEDGCLQGILRWLKVAFVGCDVLASALSMDKWAAKLMLDGHGIRTAPWAGVTRTQFYNGDYPEALDSLTYPLFVKPADLGSSVGITKVDSPIQLPEAFRTAFTYTRRVIVEQAIVGKEIECAIMGSDELDQSVLGELEVNAAFYDYDTKYVDADAAKLVIPAKLPQDQIEQIQLIAAKVYRLLGCEGLARIDFFVGPQSIFVNEVNTLPGFTSISMFPKLMMQDGRNRFELMDQLIELALKRHKQYESLRYSQYGRCDVEVI